MSEAIQASILAYAVAVLKKAGDEDSVKKIELMQIRGVGPSQEEMDEVAPPPPPEGATEAAAPAEPPVEQPPA